MSIAREGAIEGTQGAFIATHLNISMQCVTEYTGPIYVSEHQCIPLADTKGSSISSPESLCHIWEEVLLFEEPHPPFNPVYGCRKTHIDIFCCQGHKIQLMSRNDQ